MARHLPAVLPGGNGKKPAPSRRDAHGRFVAGSAPGPGRPANPFARYQAELRGVLLAEVTPADVRTILRQVLRLAKRGNLAATELILKWTVGRPPPPVDPDRLDAHELDVRRGRPTLVDWVALSDEQADREPVAIPATAAEEPEDPDPLHPPLRTVLAWAIQELAEAQTALRTQGPPPPDPATGWQRFSESHVEWSPEAAVEVDLLYMAYAKWCASHGELALEEAKVVAALQAHGASLRTGALTQTAMVQGVRVTA